MGGPNSGYPIWKTQRETVESCLYLEASRLDLRRHIGRKSTGDITWRDQKTGLRKSALDITIDLRDLYRPYVEIRFRVRGEGPGVIQKIPLVYSYPFFGGFRFWFSCPLCHEKDLAPLRVRKLYLPLDGGTAFGCRRCHDLTYDSCQDSHRFDRLFLDIAQEVYGSHGDDNIKLGQHIRRGLVNRSN